MMRSASSGTNLLSMAKSKLSPVQEKISPLLTRLLKYQLVFLLLNTTLAMFLFTKALNAALSRSLLPAAEYNTAARVRFQILSGALTVLGLFVGFSFPQHIDPYQRLAALRGEKKRSTIFWAVRSTFFAFRWPVILLSLLTVAVHLYWSLTGHRRNALTRELLLLISITTIQGLVSIGFVLRLLWCILKMLFCPSGLTLKSGAVDDAPPRRGRNLVGVVIFLLVLYGFFAPSSSQLALTTLDEAVGTAAIHGRVNHQMGNAYPDTKNLGSTVTGGLFAYTCPARQNDGPTMPQKTPPQPLPAFLPRRLLNFFTGPEVCAGHDDTPKLSHYDDDTHQLFVVGTCEVSSTAGWFSSSAPPRIIVDDFERNQIGHLDALDLPKETFVELQPIGDNWRRRVSEKIRDPTKYGDSSKFTVTYEDSETKKKVLKVEWIFTGGTKHTLGELLSDAERILKTAASPKSAEAQAAAAMKSYLVELADAVGGVGSTAAKVLEVRSFPMVSGSASVVCSSASANEDVGLTSADEEFHIARKLHVDKLTPYNYHSVEQRRKRLSARTIDGKSVKMTEKLLAEEDRLANESATGNDGESKKRHYEHAKKIKVGSKEFGGKNGGVLVIVLDAVSRGGFIRHLPKTTKWLRKTRWITTPSQPPTPTTTKEDEGGTQSSMNAVYPSISEFPGMSVDGHSTAKNFNSLMAGHTLDFDRGMFARQHSDLHTRQNNLFSIIKKHRPEVFTSFVHGYCADTIHGWWNQTHLTSSDGFGDPSTPESSFAMDIDHHIAAPGCHQTYGVLEGNFQGPNCIVKRCLGKQYAHRLFLRTIRSHMRQLTKAKRPFLQVFHTMEGHEGTQSVLATMDDDLVEFLQGLVDDGFFSAGNAVMLGADHGNHMGPFFEWTTAGKIERMMPVFTMLLPPPMAKEYAAQIAANEKLVLTHLDTYGTILDMLGVPHWLPFHNSCSGIVVNGNDEKKGRTHNLRSLLKDMPPRVACKDVALYFGSHERCILDNRDVCPM